MLNPLYSNTSMLSILMLSKIRTRQQERPPRQCLYPQYFIIIIEKVLEMCEQNDDDNCAGINDDSTCSDEGFCLSIFIILMFTNNICNIVF